MTADQKYRSGVPGSTSTTFVRFAGGEVNCPRTVQSRRETRSRCRSAPNYSLGMAVPVEMHDPGDPKVQRDVVAMVEHALSDRPGDWRVVIAGTEECDQWWLEIVGLKASERSYILEGVGGQHDPRFLCVSNDWPLQ